MTNLKSTKKAMLFCMISMLVCFGMLIGSTFAWFSDSVTSKKNKIVAGNLKVEVTHTNNAVTEEPINAEEAKLFPVTLWEPGVVSYETFTVKNAGSLAFDYKFNLMVTDANTVIVDGEEKSLKDVIKLGVIEGSVAEGTTREQLIEAIKVVTPLEGSVAKNFVNFSDFSFEDKMETSNLTKTFTIVAYWEPSESDNNYNVKDTKNPLYIDIVVNVFAKQRNYESDSFDEKYDKNAFNPDERVNTLSSQGYVVINSDVDIPENAEKVVLNSDITLSKIHHFAENAVFDANGYKVTIDHLYTFGCTNSYNGNEKGAKYITIKNAVFEKGNTWGIAVSNATFENCTFNGTSPYITPNAKSEDRAQDEFDISVTNCTFNDTMLQICWGEGEQIDPKTLKTRIENNTFNYTATKETNSAIALNAGPYSDFSTVNVSSNTFNNKGVMALSTLYITNAETESIVSTYTNNNEINAKIGYRGSTGWAKFISENNVNYFSYDSGTKILTEVLPEYNAENFIVPEGVTSIGSYAFYNNSNIKTIVLPETVTSLQERAFRGASAKSITLNEGLVVIGYQAFRDAVNLTSLIIPSTVTTICKEAFQLSGITSLTIPSTVEVIEYGACRDMKELTTVIIEGNEFIPNYAFRACEKLTDVYLKGNDVTLGTNMVFSVAEHNNDNSQITIHVVNDIVKERVLAAKGTGKPYYVVTDQTE